MTAALLLLLQVTPAAASSGSPRCASLADSVAAAADAAPERAVTLARRIGRECRGDGASTFRAGRALNRAASFEQVRADLLLREEAQHLLNRAVQLRSNDAAAWLEYSIALKKRGGLQIDAYRAIKRALELADRFPDSTPPKLLAEIQFQRARHMQDWVDRLRWLKDADALAIVTPACSGLGLFCENYTRPSDFNEQAKGARPIALDFEEQRSRLIGLYQMAVRLDPTNIEAAERYGRELALGEEWERLAALAHELAAQRVEPAFFASTEAMAYGMLGRYRLADSLFRAAIPALPDSVRRWYQSPPRGLDTIPDFWTRTRPLWVAPFNELELEYWTRLTYAFLVLRDREAEVIGPETPQGDALIRYGWPSTLIQVERDAAKILTGHMLDAAVALLNCDLAVGGCPAGAGEGATTDFSVGRWVIWMYSLDQPSLIFEQRPGLRVPRYVFDARAEEYAKVLRERSPLTFTSKLAPRSFILPAQVARFRGDDPRQTALAFYGLLPARDMGLPARDSITTGLFLFRDTSGFPIFAEQRDQFVPGDALTLTYRLRLSAGRYAYSLEAFAPAFGAAASARDSLRAPVWDPDSLLVSDLVLAHQVETRTDPPLSWQDLRVDVSRTLAVARGASLWVVWEVYGARAGREGTAKYDVTLALRDQTARAFPLRLLERLGGGRGRGPGTPVITLQWTAERRLAPDGRALEYVALQLPEDATGEYELVLTVRDATRQATTARRITVSPLPKAR